MEKAKVYYSDLRALPGTNLLVKLQKLIRRAGIGEIDMENKMVAIKIHFGEPGNLSYLRPNYAKAVADVIKELGGKPFLTDCNTLYVGRRKNALDHIDAAYENGFTPSPPAVTSSSRTVSRAPTTSRCRLSAASCSRPQKSGAPSWTPMCLSPFPTSRGTSPPVSAAV